MHLAYSDWYIYASTFFVTVANCRITHFIMRSVCSFKNSFYTFALQSLNLWNAIDCTLFVIRAEIKIMKVYRLIFNLVKI